MKIKIKKDGIRVILVIGNHEAGGFFTLRYNSKLIYDDWKNKLWEENLLYIPE